MARELDIPYGIATNDNAFEILRVWGCDGALHVSIRSDLQGGVEGFGELLCDLLGHGAKLYAEREDISENEAARKITQAMIDAADHREVQGGIPNLD